MTLTAARDFPARKFIGALAVLALHLLIIAIFIQATRSRAPWNAPVHEILLRLVPPKEEPQKPERHRAPPAPPRSIAPSQRTPDYNTFTLPPAWQGSALKGLPSLLDCAPQNQGNLTPAQIAQCQSSVSQEKHDDSAVDYADHTNRSQGTTLWARGRARKNAPTLLPCASPHGIGISLATLECLGKAAVDGKFDLDNQPGYGDRPETLHLPNNGDPPSAPPG